MKATTRGKFLLTLSLLLLVLFSCRKDEDTMWDVAVLTPIANGHLSIMDILPDSLSEVQEDGGVDLVYRQTLFSYNFVDENISIPDTIVETFVSLDSLSLSDREITQSITLGAVAEILGFPIGTFIILSHGEEVPIDPIADLTSGETPIDATSFFESATIEEGFLDIEVENGFPIPLEDITLQIRNSSDDEIIVDEFVTSILPGETFISTTPLDGKTIDGNLVAEITNFSSPGSDGVPVLIDTNDALVITMKAYNLSLFEATAIFPAQNLVNNQLNVVYDMGGPEFTEMKIKSGEVVMYIVNTIGDSIHIEYNIPGAVDEFGVPIAIETVVPPAPPGESVIVDQLFPLAGYSIDLRGQNGLLYNTFYNEFIARIDSTGEVVTISKEDSIQVIYGLQNIVPLELKGYFGQAEMVQADTIDNLGLLDDVIGGSVTLEDAMVDLVVKNGVGIEADIFLNDLTARNKNTGATQTLVAPEFIQTEVPVQRALENPFTPGYTTFALRPDNSNIKQFLEILPTSITYDTEMFVNPNGNTYNYQDFLLEESDIDLFIDMRIPLHLMANDLTLLNEFNSELSELSNRDNILDGTFTLHCENGFPLEAGVVIEFLTWNNEVIRFYDLTDDTPLPAAPLDADCRVIESAITDIRIEIDEASMQEILNADKVRIRSTYNTESLPPCNTTLRIYSDYYLDFVLSADFRYRVNLNN